MDSETTGANSDSERARRSAVDRSRRRFLAGAAGASLATLASSGVGAAQDGETVTIVHDTHFHGRFRDATADDLNIARYDTIVRDLLSDAENAMFVGNGDDLAPSMLGLEYEGEHMIEALNAMDLDVNGVGNHEFDFGAEVATQRFEESEFPWVAANLLTDEGEPVPGTERWTTFDRGGLTIGVFGLGSETFHSLTSYPEEWQVLGNVEAAREAVDALREKGADLVVCASHVSNGTHYRIAEEVDGLDAIVGSHSGITFEEPEVHEGTLISEFGDEFAHVGAITLDSSGELVDWERVDLWLPEEDGEEPPEGDDNVRVVDVTGVDENDDLVALVDEWATALDERLGQPFFESEVELNATWENYAVETNWGNLMTDVMREVGETADFEVDVAAQNAGGIRSGSTYGPGEITGSDVMNILPFPNEIQVVEVTGAELVDYLEGAIRPHPDAQYGVQPAIQVSGVSYEWWGHDDEAEVSNVFVGGEPVDPEATYHFAHNDYSIENDPVLSEAELVLESGQFQGPYVLDKLEARGTVAPERENRMIRVDEDVGAAEASRDDDAITISAPVPESANEIATDAFRAVIRTGDDLAARGVAVEGDTIRATFDAADLLELAGQVDDPALRLFGGYDPDDAYYQEAYGYENDDGEPIDLPTSDGYDVFRLKADVDAISVLELGEDDSGEDGDGSGDEGGSDDGDDEPGDGGSGDDGSSGGDDESGDSNDGTGDGDDSVPGFGPLGALAGSAGGAYLYSRAPGDEPDDAPEE